MSGLTTDLNNIGKGLFTIAKIKDTGDQDERDNGGRGEQHGDRRNRRMEDRPAEALDDAGHGVEQSVSKTILRRDEGAGVNDRRGKKETLDEEGDNIANVTKFNVERGEPEPDAEGKGEDKAK